MLRKRVDVRSYTGLNDRSEIDHSLLLGLSNRLDKTKSRRLSDTVPGLLALSEAVRFRWTKRQVFYLHYLAAISPKNILKVKAQE